LLCGVSQRYSKSLQHYCITECPLADRTGPATLQAGALCGAPQSSGVEFKTRADAAAAPSTPEGAAALVAARLLGARCVREAVGRAVAEFQGLRAAAAAVGKAAVPASEGAGDAAVTGSPTAEDKQLGQLPAAGDDSVRADSAAVVGAGPAHRDKRQRREAGVAAPEQPPAGTAAASAAEAVPRQHVSEDDDEYMGDVSDVSMSDDDGNDSAVQRSKGAVLLGELANSAAADGADPSDPDRTAGAAQPARQARAAPAGGERADRPAKKQKKAKPVQKPKNRCATCGLRHSSLSTVASIASKPADACSGAAVQCM